MTPLIELEDVCIVRGGAPILHRLSLRIEVGEHVAILGPNGSGKSTLIQLMSGQIYPFAGSGTVRILGKERWDRRDLESALGVVASGFDSPLGEPTAMEWVATAFLPSRGVTAFEPLGPEMEGAARVALERVGAERLEARALGTLSAGERRRVEIARSLVLRPQCLVLDEPTTSLDLAAAAALVRDLRGLARSGTSLLLVTHHMPEVIPEIERVILLSQGRVLADGSKAQVLTSRNLSRQYGQPVEVSWRDGVPHAAPAVP